MQNFQTIETAKVETLIEKSIAVRRMAALFFIKILLLIHSLSYRTAGFLAARLEEKRLHPKHRIMNYHKFFVDNVNKDDIVLDIGCGNGALTYDIAKKATRVVGIDLNKSNVLRAREIYMRHNIEYICGDALVDLPDEHFDAIVLSNILEHIEKRGEFLKTLKQKSTKLLIRVPMIDRDWITLYKKEMGMDYRLDKGHHIEYTLEDFGKEMEEAEFRIKDYSIQFGEIWAVVCG